MNMVHLFNLFVLSGTAAIVYLTLGFFTIEFLGKFLEDRGINFPTYLKVIVFILNPIIIPDILIVAILNFILKKLVVKDFKW